MKQLTIYDVLGREEISISKPIRTIELFGGYGSQAMALEIMGVKFEHYRLVEFDKYAVNSYNAVHGTDFKPADITNTHAEDLGIRETHKYCYLMTYSFPCQDLSLAGKRAGMTKGSGTRSGLLWEVERILKEIVEVGGELPQVLFMENVKQVISKKNKPDFDKWCNFLESIGYTNTYKVLNAKDYGIPQNRERCFMFSFANGMKYDFPEPIQLKYRIKDILERKVDEKYYIKADTAKKLIEKLIAEKKICDSITDVKQVGNIVNTGNWENPQVGRVYSEKGLSPALNTCGGGGHEPKIITEYIPQDVKVRKYTVDTERFKKVLKEKKHETNISITDIAKTLKIKKTTVEHWFRNDDCFSIPDPEIWSKLKELLGIKTEEFDKSITEFEIKANNYDMSNRVYQEIGISPVITAQCSDTKIIQSIPCKLDKHCGKKEIKNIKNAILKENIVGISSTITSHNHGYGSDGDNLIIVAQRGRNPENPNDRTPGIPTEQRLDSNTNGVSNTITTVQKDNLVLQAGYLEHGTGKHQSNTVYDEKGIAPAVTTVNGGGTQQIKILERKVMKVGNINPSQRGINGEVIDSCGICKTITTNKGEGPKILIRQATKKGYIEMEQGGICDGSYPESKTRRGRVIDNGNICPTLQANDKDIIKIDCENLPGAVLHNGIYYRIRKLTPKECGRLMGVPDQYIDKMAAVNSNTQLYKQFGNSIVVNCMIAMFSNLNIQGLPNWDEIKEKY